MVWLACRDRKDFWFTRTAMRVKSPVFILTSDGEEKIKKITLPTEPNKNTLYWVFLFGSVGK
jgi:hypothetical protein